MNRFLDPSINIRDIVSESARRLYVRISEIESESHKLDEQLLLFECIDADWFDDTPVDCEDFHCRSPISVIEVNPSTVLKFFDFMELVVIVYDEQWLEFKLIDKSSSFNAWQYLNLYLEPRDCQIDSMAYVTPEKATKLSEICSLDFLPDATIDEIHEAIF